MYLLEKAASPFWLPSLRGVDFSPWLSTFKCRGEQKILAEGEYFLHEGDVVERVYLLSDGILADIISNANGLEKWDLLFAPYLTAFFATMHGAPIAYRSLAFTECVLYSLPEEEFLQLMQADEALLRAVLLHNSLEIRQSNQSLYTLYMASTPRKIIQTLYYYHVYLAGVEKPAFRLTQQLIANLSGVHRTSVAATVAKLRKRGILGANIAAPLDKAASDVLYALAFAED